MHAFKPPDKPLKALLGVPVAAALGFWIGFQLRPRGHHAEESPSEETLQMLQALLQQYDHLQNQYFDAERKLLRLTQNSHCNI